MPHHLLLPLVADHLLDDQPGPLQSQIILTLAAQYSFQPLMATIQSMIPLTIITIQLHITLTSENLNKKMWNRQRQTMKSLTTLVRQYFTSLCTLSYRHTASLLASSLRLGTQRCQRSNSFSTEVSLQWSSCYSIWTGTPRNSLSMKSQLNPSRL